ncbi:serine/threonine protein kinase [Pochonia chlamydosporia 170]|uniref:Serine/threonine protein kinase n=1 Tax=Pochonia chlamydosporia 170 TaxID=1380566 RepID=A0A179F864_METCM|nr:serine/threonine protein kinase [Pochonia chlamydosporia 170]OAQ61461.1 serine/threonine protein kinase [Pochonia chlamydosporia 170]
MSNTQDIIAWLVPTARGTPADKATNIQANNSRTVSTSSSSYLSSKLSDISSKPQRAIQLCFSRAPRRLGSFVLGTDPNLCDVVLPKMAGISAQHCSISFDAESRLVLDDFSERGTQVWYDWECSGDQRDYSWILSSGSAYGFPSTVQRIAIDIQGVRFQLVVNDHSDNWDAYKANVDAFCEQPSWTDGFTSDWDTDVMYAQPLFQHIFVKGHGGEPTGEIYLWDMSRPWEPMVRAAA